MHPMHPTEVHSIKVEHYSHVGASFVSLALTFFERQSALTPLLLLFIRDPLALSSRLMMRVIRIYIAQLHHNPTLTLMESGWDFYFVYLIYSLCFRSFRNKSRGNVFSLRKSTLTKQYSLNDYLLLRSPNREMRSPIPISVQLRIVI